MEEEEEKERMENANLKGIQDNKDDEKTDSLEQSGIDESDQVQSKPTQEQSSSDEKVNDESDQVQSKPTQEQSNSYGKVNDESDQVQSKPTKEQSSSDGKVNDESDQVQSKPTKEQSSSDEETDDGSSSTSERTGDESSICDERTDDESDQIKEVPTPGKRKKKMMTDSPVAKKAKIDKKSYENEDGDILKSFMSIYKIQNDRIPDLANVKNTDALRHCIVKTLVERGNVEHDEVKKRRMDPFFITHFVYCKQHDLNLTSTKITKDLVGTKKEFCGDRTSGSILVYYRLKSGIPEIYCLCNNKSFHAVIQLSDPLFRVQVVKRYMNDRNIKEIETINIAGQDIMTRNTYRYGGGSIVTQTSAYLEKVVTRISGFVEIDSELRRTVQQKDKGYIRLEVGNNFVKIKTHLSYEGWAMVLALFSKDLEGGDGDGISCHALEYVNKITDIDKINNLTKTLSDRAKHAICGKKSADDLLLSHRYVRDFELSSPFKLLVSDKKKETIIKTWKYTPTLRDVIDEVKNFFPESEVMQLLDDDKLKLSVPENGKFKSYTLQNLVHGSVTEDGSTYYRVGQKWYTFSSTYSEVIDKNFANLVKNGVISDDLANIFPYPWSSTPRSFNTKEVEQYFNIDHDDACRFVGILQEEVNITDDKGNLTLTEMSCLLPKSSELFKDLDPPKDKLASKSYSQTAYHSSDAPDAESKKQKSTRIHAKLFDLVSGNDSKGNSKPFQNVHQMLAKRRCICKKKNDTNYYIKNAILTNDILSKIRAIQSLEQVTESKVSKFLRFTSKLTEDEYNQLYLHCEDENYRVILGDKILANNVELFDVLIHDKKKTTTYLFHCKDNFGNITRDSCAQLRNSSELLWHDFLRGNKTHISHFWNHAVETNSHEPWRCFLKKKLMDIGQKQFENMFSAETKLVFVYAYAHKLGSNHLNLHFQPITLECLAKNTKFQSEECKRVFDFLMEARYINSKGYLEDVFITTTQEKFVKSCTNDGALKNHKQDHLKEIYRTLKKYGSCDLSTIAKLELLTLDSCFARYQIGGKKHFELKYFQIESKYVARS